MSETPKFEVIDRRKLKAEEERTSVETPVSDQRTTQTVPEPTRNEPAAGPRLVVTEPRQEARAEEREPAEEQLEMPPAPSAEESREQKKAYDASAQRLEDLIRAQNPAMGAPPPVTFENLVQQLYVSAMIQMGAGAQEGQRPRVDILGARTTIDLLDVLAEKTRGNVTEAEDRTLQSVLFEVRMAFLEISSMISMQGVQPPTPPPPGIR